MPEWQHALAELERRGPMPSRWSILSLEVRRSYWDVLAYERDGLAEQAAAARADFTGCVQRLRDAYDAHPDLGAAAADEVTDRAIQQAQADFARDVLRPCWREKRGARTPYF